MRTSQMERRPDGDTPRRSHGSRKQFSPSPPSTSSSERVKPQRLFGELRPNGSTVTFDSFATVLGPRRSQPTAAVDYPNAQIRSGQEGKRERGLFEPRLLCEVESCRISKSYACQIPPAPALASVVCPLAFRGVWFIGGGSRFSQVFRSDALGRKTKARYHRC